MILESWNPDMGLNRYPSAANQQLDATLLGIVQYSEKGVNGRIVVETD
jgi:hypothetical protein